MSACTRPVGIFSTADSYRLVKGLLSQFSEKLKPEALALMATLPPVPEME